MPNRCPLTYELCDSMTYSEKGLSKLHPKLKSLEFVPFTSEELRQEALLRIAKMSVQGVQPKLSAILNLRDGCFEFVDQGGKYIIKPQAFYPELPENEDLTMHLAKEVGIDVPQHGLILAKDRSLIYFVKRFDRVGHKGKLYLEDFAQLAGKSRDTKYNYRTEKVISLIREHCTFPSPELLGLPEKVIQQVVEDFARVQPTWNEWIDASFLSDTKKQAYKLVVEDRLNRLGVVCPRD